MTRHGPAARAVASVCGLAVVFCIVPACAPAARADEMVVEAWSLAAAPRDVRAVREARPPAFDEPASGAQLDEWLAAPGGPTRIWLGAQTYEGNFAVNRPVTIRGAQGAILRGTGRGSVVQVNADGVIIENVTIEHTGRRLTSEDSGIKAKGKGVRISHVVVRDSLFGIVLEGCSSCTVEYSHVTGLGQDEALQGDGIKLWNSDDSTVRKCLVEDSRDVVVWYSRRATVEHNTVSRGRYGAHFMYATDSIVRGNRMSSNVVGVFVMYSARLRLEGNLLAGSRGAAGVGAGFKDSDGVVVTGNALIANTTGAYLDGTPRDISQLVRFRENRFALNDVAVRLHGASGGISFRCNVFQENTSSAVVEGGGDALRSEFLGNRWHDYVGYDLDRDGTGDVAYQIKKLSGEMTDAHPSLSFFQGTFAMGFVDAISRAVPVLASRLLLVDPQPLVGGECRS